MKEFFYQTGKTDTDVDWFSCYEDAEDFARELSLSEDWCNIVEYDEDGHIHWIASYENGKKRPKEGRTK